MKEVGDDSFAAFVKQPHLTVLIFGAPWCGPCRKMKALATESLEKRDYGSSVEFGYFDTDKSPETPAHLHVSSIPTVMLYIGGIRQNVSVGFHTETEYVEMIEAALASPVTPESRAKDAGQ